MLDDFPSITLLKFNKKSKENTVSQAQKKKLCKTSKPWAVFANEINIINQCNPDKIPSVFSIIKGTLSR